MTEQRLSYSDVLLGNALNTILEATNSAIPKMRESEFKLRVLPLIQRPFHRAHLNAYVKVVGELTNPLHVMSDDNPDELLFEVPALIQSTGTTLPSDGAPASDVTMRAIYNEGERGVDINPIIADFLKRITNIKDIRTAVLDPLRAILNRYDMEIDVSDETDLVKDEPMAKQKDPTAESSTFTDEYE